MVGQNSSWNAEYNSVKGSLLVGNGTRPVVEPVGADGFVLTADSAQPTGVTWAASSGGPPSDTASFLALLTISAVGLGANPTFQFSSTSGALVTTTYNVGAGFDFNTGIFTAPVTGKYLFVSAFRYSGATDNTTMTMDIQLTNFPARNFQIIQTSTAVINSECTFTMTAMGDLSVGQTALTTIGFTGGTTSNITILASAVPQYVTYFSGTLI